jgi:hypothetical protein
MFLYEARVFDGDRVDDQRRLQLRITYQHCLRLLGRGQGGLLYTTTLLPGEAVQLYEYDRYRRVRSQTEAPVGALFLPPDAQRTLADAAVGVGVRLRGHAH